MSAVKLWRLCAGHFRVRRVPRSPVFHTCAQLPPHHVEVMLAVPLVNSRNDNDEKDNA
jgi:hypothetical protein